jgi:3-deoxy-D-manno-octulosonic acid kinase
MLERVRALGVRAPKPLVFVTKGSLFYSTWLVMHELTDVRTLVEVSMHDEELLGVAMERLADQMRIVVAHRILHVDLHPGNVLVGADGAVSLVDFDKARVFSGSVSDLSEVYLRRWRRAVIKHRLSPVLTERMSLILRSHHDGI